MWPAIERLFGRSRTSKATDDDSMDEGQRRAPREPSDEETLYRHLVRARVAARATQARVDEAERDVAVALDRVRKQPHDLVAIRTWRDAQKRHGAVVAEAGLQKNMQHLAESLLTNTFTAELLQSTLVLAQRHTVDADGKSTVHETLAAMEGALDNQRKLLMGAMQLGQKHDRRLQRAGVSLGEDDELTDVEREQLGLLERPRSDQYRALAPAPAPVPTPTPVPVPAATAPNLLA